MKNVSVSEAQTLKKPIFCNVRLEKNAHIYIYISGSKIRGHIGPFLPHG